MVFFIVSFLTALVFGSIGKLNRIFSGIESASLVSVGSPVRGGCHIIQRGERLASGIKFNKLKFSVNNTKNGITKIKAMIQSSTRDWKS